MTHRDILDRPDSIKSPFLKSIGLHVSMAGIAVAVSYAGAGPVNLMGDPNSLGGGGAVAVTPVATIPIPSRGGMENLLANDTESEVPKAPKQVEQKAAVADDREAIALKGKEAKDLKNKPAAKPTYYSPPGANRPNQVYSNQGQAASSAMFGTTSTGSGDILGNGNPFGNRFGAYVALVREKVGRNWKTDQIDNRMQTAPTVKVSFEIQRNGSVTNVSFIERSGNVILDAACQRAIAESAPFEPLPPGFEKSSATFEFWFNLKR